jgi:hypothetical protein
VNLLKQSPRAYAKVAGKVDEIVHGTLKNSRWHDPVANVVNALGFQACFVAGTPVRLVDGWRAIEELLVGDRLLSRSEWDAAGALVACEVTAVHVREALVWELVLGGQTIVTTAEHPFFSVERGWVKLQELAVGETLVGHDGQWTKVASVRNTNEWRTVYNVTVAEHHTYFVGKDEWGFSVWVHNARYKPGNTAPKLPPKVIAQRGNVRIEHYFHGGKDHGPAHLHIIDGKKETRIGAMGLPGVFKSDKPLTPSMQKLVDANRSQIRAAINKIHHWITYQRQIHGGIQKGM